MEGVVTAPVTFVIRSDRETKAGGDVEQAKAYARILQGSGRDIGWADMADAATAPAGRRVHVFNVDRPYEFIGAVRSLGPTRWVRAVVSPIHHSHEHVERFEAVVRSGPLRVLGRALPSWAGREYAKHAVRAARDRSIPDLLPLRDRALRAEIGRALDAAAAVLCLSGTESDWLAEDFGYRGHNTVVVPNGFTPGPVVDRPREVDVLVVGRIEERKNPLGVARALAGSGLRTRFVGRPNPTSRAYVDAFAAVVEQATELDWLPGAPPEDMPGLYAGARCLVNASFFEVAPLVELEALAQGTRVITTPFAARADVPGWEPTICDPYDLSGLAEQVWAELAAEPPTAGAEWLRHNLSWPSAGRALVAAYDRIDVAEAVGSVSSS